MVFCECSKHYPDIQAMNKHRKRGCSGASGQAKAQKSGPQMAPVRGDHNYEPPPVNASIFPLPLQKLMNNRFDLEKAEKVYEKVLSDNKPDTTSVRFIYLLLAPFLASKSFAPFSGQLSFEKLLIFISSIFYVGKGSGERPFKHEMTTNSKNVWFCYLIIIFNNSFFLKDQKAKSPGWNCEIRREANCPHPWSRIYR